jgi:transcriptional regulator with XRE-family HTH domain
MTRKLPQSRREARRLLGAELRRLRELARLRSLDIAKVIGKSMPTVSRIEAGDRAITPEQVQAWLAAVRDTRPDAFSAEEAAYVEQLTVRATAEISPLAGTLAARQAGVGELEKAATTIRSWQPFYIPGLLQTADYARALLTSLNSPDEVEDAVAGRIARQSILGDSSREFEFIMTEMGLRWRTEGPDPRPQQLRQIASIAGLRHVAVRVIPLDAIMHVAPDGPFTLYEGDDGAQVTAEMPHRRLDIPEVEGYQEELGLLRRSTLSNGDAAAFIRALAAEISDAG